MNEKLLQFIWQFRYYNAAELQTTDGESVEVIFPGELNTHQGPDFSNARIKIGETTWAGSVELHIKTSDWHKHQHETDANYGKIVLHVVYQHDEDISPGNHKLLVLENRVSKLMMDQYTQWVMAKRALPCAGQMKTVPPLVWNNWKDRMLTERLEQKIDRIEFHLAQTNQHWEEVFYRMLCRYFGSGINADSFEQVAVSVPLQLLSKHKNQIHQLEAILLGQAAILHKDLPDEYSQMLFKEYQFLQKKYELRVINKPPLFLRLRPVNFPSVRLAQFAMLVHSSVHLFSKILEATAIKDVYNLLDVTANDYWHYHFKPGVAAEYQPKHLGKQAIDLLIVNAVAPVLFAYGKKMDEPLQCTKAMQWLQQTPGEKNSITQVYKLAGINSTNAYDTQALLHLKKNYCDPIRCLECAVGNNILKSKI
jgi:hypothetical protein